MPLPQSVHPLAPGLPIERPPPAWRRWLLYYAPPVLLMGVIFIASTDVGSSEHSGRVLCRLLAWLGWGQWATPPRLDLINHYIRKLGHVTEYALLAVLLHRAVVAARLPTGSCSARWSFRCVFGVLALVVLYASSDEFHQRFVAGRTSSVWDVLLDTVGGGAGLTIKRAWEALWRRHRSG
jgi:VanZ family protein